MTIKNSLGIYMCNFRTVYRIILFLLLVGMVAYAFGYILYIPTVRPLAIQIENLELDEDVKLAGRQLLSGDAEYVDTVARIESKAETITQMIESSRGKIYWYVALGIVILLLTQMVIHLAYYVATDLFDKAMSSLHKESFFSSLLANFRSALTYASLSTLIYAPIYVLILGLCYGILKLILPVFGIFSPAIVLAIGFVLLAFKFALFSNFLPTMVKEKIGVFRALKTSVVKGINKVVDYMALYWIALFMIYTLSLIIIVVTLGLAAFLALPSAASLIGIIQLVLYYNENNLSYYVSPSEVVTARTTEY